MDQKERAADPLIPKFVGILQKTGIEEEAAKKVNSASFSTQIFVGKQWVDILATGKTVLFYTPMESKLQKKMAAKLSLSLEASEMRM